MFESVRNDASSGATELGRRAALEIADLAEASRASDPGAFWERMTEICRALIEARPGMAPLVNLASAVLAAAERTVLSGLPADAAKRAVALEAARFAEGTPDGLERLGKKGAPLIGRGSTVATLSASESVAAVLAAAGRAGGTPSVLLSESRPALEGRHFATSLAARGVTTTLVGDAALPGLIDRAAVALVGADTVSEESFVNKVGTYPLALAAREASVPLYVASLRSKFLPLALLRASSPASPGGAPAAASGRAVSLDHVLETVPLSLVTGIITEDGLISPTDMPAALAERPVAPALLPILFPRREGRAV